MPPKYSDQAAIIELIEYCLRFWLAGRRLLMMLCVLPFLFKTSAELRLENLALRHLSGLRDEVSAFRFPVSRVSLLLLACHSLT